jgi:hypothetical protein
MTTQTLTRGLRARPRRSRGSDEHPPITDQRPEREEIANSTDAAAAASVTPPASEREADGEWSAHRMASFLCMLTALASEEPVDTFGEGRALRDIFAARLLDNPPGEPWSVNARGRELLAEWGLDRPIPIAILTPEELDALGVSA